MNLGLNWISEPVFDFESKKYQLLGYLKLKETELSAKKIYPHLNELQAHSNYLQYLLGNKKKWDDSFRKEINGIDYTNFEINYKKREDDERGIEDFLEIINYSQNKINDCYSEFISTVLEFEKNIQFKLMGLMPQDIGEGFLMIRQLKKISIFNYKIHSLLNSNGEKQFNYTYVNHFTPSISVNESSIKKEIINKLSSKTYPVFFHVNCTDEYPLYETVLPIAGKELNKWMK